ncbi:unnamed protein product [Blepharisma stoltei]|uniref:Uncharacterized protein n=1 Tax=Blepharisma stoltei TaxID=1481888 RepID=A0AAU9JQW8_9CILI|nr:unnamed protein product [Blepharisma stoltei]
MRFEDLMSHRHSSLKKPKLRPKSVALRKEPTFKLIVEVPSVIKVEENIIRSKSTEPEHKYDDVERQYRLPLILSKLKFGSLIQSSSKQTSFNHIEKSKKSAGILSPYLCEGKLKQFSVQEWNSSYRIKKKLKVNNRFAMISQAYTAAKNN